MPSTNSPPLESALLALNRGRWAHAESLVRDVLIHRPTDADALHLLGVLHARRGSYQEAIVALRAALRAEPAAAEAWKNLGAVLHSVGQSEEAASSCERALSLDPTLGDAWYNRGKALEGLARQAGAAESYVRALDCEPRHLAAWQALGAVLDALGRFNEALAAWQQARELAPADASLWYNTAVTLIHLQRYDEALQSSRQACRLDPDGPAWLTAGVCLRQTGRLHEARDALVRATQLCPADANGWNNLGNVLLALGQPEQAIAAYERALAHSGPSAETLTNRAVAQAARGAHELAVADCSRALEHSPAYSPALQRRGSTWLILGNAERAQDDLARAVELEPAQPFGQGLLLRARAELCDWRDEERLRADLLSLYAAGRPENPLTAARVVDSPELQLAIARNFARHRHLDTTRAVGPRAAPSPAAGRIRLAYISADFREHPVALAAAGLLESHDRDRFEVVGISLGPEDGSPMRRRLERAFDKFIDGSRLSDEEVAQTIRRHGIDIAIDLMGYTTGARPGILQYRPAPVQVSYLGYPGTLALPYVDYLIADEHVIPEATRAFYTEQVVYLPHCFLPYDASRSIRTAHCSRASAGLPENSLILGSFNSPYKITREVFDIWLRALKEHARCALWIGAPAGATRDNLLREAAEAGVPPERIIFAERCERSEDHLSRLALADLYLDTYPYNGHTTACEALHAGVPVLTCSGASFAARVAGSAVRAAGLGDLVTPSLGAYETSLRRVLENGADLARLREQTRAAGTHSALFDAEGYRRHLEGAFVRMWQRHRDGGPPCDIGRDRAPRSEARGSTL